MSAPKVTKSELPIAARRQALVREVERGLQRCAVLPADGPVKIIIALSGGADSTALLLACIILAWRRSLKSNLQLTAVHVHHHLRDSADDDARFVERLCRKFDVPLRIEHVQPAALRGNLSANARRLRYERLAAVAQEEGAAHVAVAHHAEDQLETVIAALCRGAGLDGLGMAWSRPLADDVSLVRPLLASRRSECESLCRAAKIRWREDPTNLDVTKTRARLRRDVLPVLEELWPDAAIRASATAELIHAAKTALEHELDRHFGAAAEQRWPRAALQTLPASIIAAGLRRAAMHHHRRAAEKLTQRHLLQAADIIASRDRRPHRLEWPGSPRLSLDVTSKWVRLGV